MIAAGFLGLMFYRFFGPGYLNPDNWAIIAAAKRDGSVIEQRQVQRNRPDGRLDRYDQAMVTMRRLQYDRTTWVRREGPSRAIVTIDASSRSYGPRHHEVVVVRDRRGYWRVVDAR